MTTNLPYEPTEDPESFAEHDDTQVVVRRYFPALDGLRCIAAIGVALSHAGTAFEPSKTLLSYGGAIIRPGLFLFFFISGFLVYRSFARSNVLAAARRQGWDLDPTLTQSSGAQKTSGWLYLLKRFVRIMPLYWVVLTIWIVLNPDVRPSGAMEYIQVYLLLWFPDPSVLIDKGLGLPTWSLAIELPFYLFVPLYAAALRWVGAKVLPKVSPFVIEAGGIAAFTFLILLATVLLNPLASGLLTLIVGLSFGVLSVREDLEGRGARWVDAIARHWAVCLAVVGVLWLVDAQVALAEEKPFESSAGLTHLVLWTIMTTLMFVPAAFGPLQDAYVRALSSHPMVLLAPLTYGFYLWHPVVVYYAAELVGNHLWTIVYLTLIGGMILAFLTRVLVELPLNRARDRLEVRLGM